jgi:hypothetical protein
MVLQAGLHLQCAGRHRCEPCAPLPEPRTRVEVEVEMEAGKAEGAEGGDGECVVRVTDEGCGV